MKVPTINVLSVDMPNGLTYTGEIGRDREVPSENRVSQNELTLINYLLVKTEKYALEWSGQMGDLNAFSRRDYYSESLRLHLVTETPIRVDMSKSLCYESWEIPANQSSPQDESIPRDFMRVST
jgi:hypothetical protein